MKIKIAAGAIVALASLHMTGCNTYETKVDNSAGRATVYNDVGTVAPVQGVGIESQDVVSMSDRMVRDLLSNPMLVNRSAPPRIQVDATDFKNESASRINKRIITDRLRVNLNRSANGRLLFVGRTNIQAVMKERELKRSGMVDGGTIRQARAMAGVDFKMTGRIASLNAMDPKTGLTSRFHQITFELLDMEYGTIVWSNIYDFKKTAQDDIIYR